MGYRARTYCINHYNMVIFTISSDIILRNCKSVSWAKQNYNLLDHCGLLNYFYSQRITLINLNCCQW